jgi:hypothetical protein
MAVMENKEIAEIHPEHYYNVSLLGSLTEISTTFWVRHLLRNVVQI